LPELDHATLELDSTASDEEQDALSAVLKEDDPPSEHPAMSTVKEKEKMTNLKFILVPLFPDILHYLIL